jgi:hypothetical protein
VTAKKQPLVVSGGTGPEVARALRLAEENGVRIILAGGAEAWKTAAALKEKGVPVLLTLRFPERPRESSADAEESLREMQRRADAPKNAGRLHAAGVRFAFTSEGLSSPRDFLGNVRKAVREGLPPEAALRSLTLGAAEILGVQEQLGSIEKGKIANLLIAEGDILAGPARIRHVFVDGEKYDPPAEEARPGGRETPRASLTGRWTGSADAPIGRVQLTFQFTQTGDELTGTVATTMSSAPITGGSVSGRDFRFRATLRVGEQDFALVFTGTAEGDMLRGKIADGDVQIDFTATRAPSGGL